MCLRTPYTLNLHRSATTPDDPADSLRSDDHPDLTFSVYELGDAASNTGTIDFYGELNSLDPTRFANPQGGAVGAPQTVVPMSPIQSF